MSNVKVNVPNNLKYLANADIFELNVQLASEIKDRPQTWLWENFIPYETCTLIAGVPGIGKSQFLMWLTSAVSKGLEFKLNSLPFEIKQGEVLILACEDNPETGIIPRLKALGSKLEKIHIVRTSTSSATTKKTRLVALDEDLLLIEDFIKNHPDLKLIIVDPITGFVGKVKDYVDFEVRNFLNSLNELAEKYKIAIVLNKHLRKPKGDGIGAAINEVAGSGAWIAVVRQAFVICPYHEDDSLILFSNLKVNLNKKTKEAFSYRIESFSYQNVEGENIFTSCLSWQNEIIKMDADEALNKNLHEEKSKTRQVKEYIFNRLKDGGVFLRVLTEECRDKFQAQDAIIYRVKKDLKIGESKGMNNLISWYLTNDSPKSV